MARKKAAAEVVGIIMPRRERVEGLGVATKDALWLGRTVEERQERAFLRGGARPGPDDAGRERVVVASDVAILPEAIRAIVELGREAGEPITVKPAGELGKFLSEACFDRKGFLAGYLPPGEPARARALDEARILELDPVERVLNIPVQASQFGADIIQIPVSDRLVFPAGHWLQLLWANLLGLGSFLWRELAGATLPGVVWRIGLAVLRAASTDPYKVGPLLGRRGKSCRIHRSAVVEGCWLGDDVEIGANAVVRGCVLADGARVEDLAQVEFSVLGMGAIVQRQALAKYSVLGARCACAGTVQLGVLGPQAALKHGATLMDINLSQGVRIRAGKQLFRAPLGIAGVCMGADSVVGSGVRVAAGRALPPGINVVLPASAVLSTLPAKCRQGNFAVVDGKLERL